MTRLYCIILCMAFSAVLSGQQLVDASFSSTTSVGQLSLFSNDAIYNVDHYKIRYYTTDVDGTQTIASGALLVPSTTACDSFPMGVYEHGTVLHKEQVPSRDGTDVIPAKVLASTGAIGIAPDYLGLGDNPGLHPYLHGESEATATLDLIRASREYLTDSLGVELNGEVYVTGYSQGGHAAMATVKYVQDQNLFSEFNIVGAGPASGPYNLSGSQKDVLISNAPYSNPGYVVYLLFAMNQVYGNIFQDYSDILKSPYDSLIPPYFDGSYDMSAVNALLPDTLSGFLQDSVLANFANDTVGKTHPIWQALLANDNYDWNPSFPMELYYCTMDEQVSFQNALDAESAMQAQGANVTALDQGALNHGGCFLPALQSSLTFFFSLSTDCKTVGEEEFEAGQELSLFPNPASDEFYLEGFEGAAEIEAFDLSGRKVHQQSIELGDGVNVKNWKRGTYLLKIKTANGEMREKLMLTH